MVEDGRHVAQDTPSRNLQSRLGLHLRGSGLQSGADEEPCSGSLRISSGRTVPEANKSAIRAYKLHENDRKKLLGEGEEPSPSIFFISLLDRWHLWKNQDGCAWRLQIGRASCR